MSEWIGFLIFAILAGVALVTGWAARPRNAQYEVIEEDPCDTCLRWSECNGVDDGCPLKARNNHEKKP